MLDRRGYRHDDQGGDNHLEAQQGKKFEAGQSNIPDLNAVSGGRVRDCLRQADRLVTGRHVLCA
jgi:hypothetical protein